MNEITVTINDQFETNRDAKARAIFGYLTNRGLLDPALPKEWDKLLPYQRYQFIDMVAWYAEPTVTVTRKEDEMR